MLLRCWFTLLLQYIHKQVFIISISHNYKEAVFILKSDDDLTVLLNY